MKIQFNTYKKRNGEIMLYINRSNKCSVGMLGPYAAYGKYMTQGKRNTADAGIKVFRANAVPFTGNLDQHDETGFCAPVQCGGYTLVGTDVATIGGMKVESDGHYLVRDNLILPINSEWLEE